MRIQDYLFEQGIPTYTYTIFVKLTGETQQRIGRELESNVGFIYGLSTISDTTTTNNTNDRLLSIYSNLTLTTNNLEKVFLNINFPKKYFPAPKPGQKDKKFNTFFSSYRLDQLLFVQPGIVDVSSTVVEPVYKDSNRFMPIMLPNDIVLSESFFYNPTRIGAPGHGEERNYAALTFHYVDINTYQGMINRNEVFQYGIRRK